ncbi:MAG: hypothetical protein IIZ47_05160 [Erysipelotrichaceae bacterium]|nr:hypothetical protein [Erysipelotrichaceae bacterium]
MRKGLLPPKEILVPDENRKEIYLTHVFYDQDASFPDVPDAEWKMTGEYLKPKDFPLDFLTVRPLEDEEYEIIWQGNDDHPGLQPKRGGKGTRALLLRPGKSGLVKYNYRYTSYSGQHYRCFYVYLVNTDIFSKDMFQREYDSVYDRLADLF